MIHKKVSDPKSVCHLISDYLLMVSRLQIFSKTEKLEIIQVDITRLVESPHICLIISVNFIQMELTSGIVQYMTFGLIDLILVCLVIWDWKSHQRKDVFLPILIVFVLSQLPTFFVLQWPTWKTFASWYLSLPLS